MLHLTVFELAETACFHKGVMWPAGRFAILMIQSVPMLSRMSLSPGKQFMLPIVFRPNEETPASGRVVIGSDAETWEIELLGKGREAVLIVSKIAMDFRESIIGNSYEQKLGLKNVGDVNYPVEFHLDQELADVIFSPTSVLLQPFSENFVNLIYRPTREIRSTVNLIVSSPYSSHTIPVTFHAGYVILELSHTHLDFGMFEKSTQPSVILNVTNAGSVKTAYLIRSMSRPPLFQIKNSKGFARVQSPRT